MESKIKKQMLLYGLVAILLASFIGVFAYQFGTYLNTVAPLNPVPTSPSSLLGTFNSLETLRDFLAENSKIQGWFPFYGPTDVVWANSQNMQAELSPSGLATYDYSGTNIQVAGVDEADIVKTDGEYLYVLSGDDLFIVKAYPSGTLKIVADLTFDDSYPAGLFVDGDRLVVIGGKYVVPTYITYEYYKIDIKTFAYIYDISDKANPILLRDLMFTGSYFNSRMIGDYVYFVISQPAYVIYDTVVLPKIYSEGQFIREIVPSEIYFYNGSDNYYQYTTFVAMNMQNATEAPTYMTLMLGGTSTMYVSQDNMYVTFPGFNGSTTVCRIGILGNNITAEAKGQVLGSILNQFSMDEYNSYFRIATATRTNGVPRSNLFIMNMDLQIVGKLSDIEVGENLDSARFLSNRCYLSTSVVRQDPFFVIDITNATAPEILGYLKIPGLNRYLHPYDETHVIGVGRDEFNKVKLSLFDVTNVTAPVNMSTYRFVGDWSDTPVFWDAKAFLFAHHKDLLTIPVSMCYYSPEYVVWQGLFLFNITLTDGFVLRGNITHQETETNGWDSSYYVKRAIYIEHVIYTISDKIVKMTSLETLEELDKIELP